MQKRWKPSKTPPKGNADFKIWVRIKRNVLRYEFTSRGGGIEIDLKDFGHEGEKMSVYQNYLGGGMLGGLGVSCTVVQWNEDPSLTRVATALKKYFADKTEQNLEQLRGRSLSAY